MREPVKMGYNGTVTDMYGRSKSILGKITARLAACRRGAAAVEFALLIPVLLVGILGVANWGTVVFAKMELVSAARAGAQLAIYYETNTTSTQTDAIKSTVVDSTNSGIATTDVDTDESYECEDGTPIADPATDSCLDNDPIQYYMTVTASDADYALLFAGTTWPISGSVKVRTK